LRTTEPRPVLGILRGSLAVLPSVLCPASDGAVDLAPALWGASGRYRVRFLLADKTGSLVGVFPLEYDTMQKPFIESFNLEPGLYLVDLQDRNGVSQGRALWLIASSAGCRHLVESFELARRYTQSWSADVSAQAALNFQSVYLQALAHDPFHAPVAEP